LKTTEKKMRPNIWFFSASLCWFIFHLPYQTLFKILFQFPSQCLCQIPSDTPLLFHSCCNQHHTNAKRGNPHHTFFRYFLNLASNSWIIKFIVKNGIVNIEDGVTIKVQQFDFTYHSIKLTSPKLSLQFFYLCLKSASL